MRWFLEQAPASLLSDDQGAGGQPDEPHGSKDLSVAAWDGLPLIARKPAQRG